MASRGQVPGILKDQNRIEEDHALVNKLVNSSKEGDWRVVGSILGTPERPKNGHMLNAIPENRRWGVLHQAVFWKTPEILRQVLMLPACDTQIKAKKCMSECGPTDRMTAVEIAKKYEYPRMIQVLEEMTPQSTFRDQIIPTFQPYDGYCDNKGLSLIALTLSCYKETFHPGTISPDRSMMSVLADVFTDISSSNARWKAVKNIVADAVYPVSVEKARDIIECRTRKKFFSEVIRAYSNEDNTIYAYLNMAFRRQRQENYMPTGDDLAMGPYCVMYQMLLLFWNKLKPENQTTYRVMKMTREDVDMYKIGMKFVWQSIVSSAVDMNHTHAFPSMTRTGDIHVLFTISNDCNSKWKPKNIEAHADFPETERTYPAGAKFMVTGRTEENGRINVTLQLL